MFAKRKLNVTFSRQPVIDLMMNDVYVYFLFSNVNVSVIVNDGDVVAIDVLHEMMNEI